MKFITDDVNAEKLKFPAYFPKIVGIMGKAGAGKDSVARSIAATLLNAEITHFADPLKQAVSAAFAMDIGRMYDSVQKEEVDPFWGKSPRQLTQWFGTEVMRTMSTPDHWILALYSHIVQTCWHKELIVVADVRFQNEYNWILANGGAIVEVIRPNNPLVMNGISSHISEDSVQFNHPGLHFEIVNEGSYNDLQKKSLQVFRQIDEEVFQRRFFG